MNKLHHWHQTKAGLLVFAVVEFAVTYGFVSMAINDGSLWWYLLALVFLVGALQNLVNFIKALAWHK